MSDKADINNIDRQLLIDLSAKASGALSEINDVRSGCNVTQEELWRACEKLDDLIVSINLAIKIRNFGD